MLSSLYLSQKLAGNKMLFMVEASGGTVQAALYYGKVVFVQRVSLAS